MTTFVPIKPDTIPDVGPGSIEGRLLNAAKTRSVPVLCQTLTPILSKERDFQWLERLFRKHESPVYVIAAPESEFRNPPGQVSIDPITRKPMPYFLWFSVNGEIEAMMWIEKFKLAKDYDENYELLKQTGFAMMDDPRS